MNRIDRVSAIIILLQTKQYITAEEVAQRYGVSRRTIYRDIKTIEEAGVPLGAEPGKGFYLVDGFHLPPVMFTRNEAAALTIAGKMVDKFTDVATRKEMQTALDKIRAVLPAASKDLVENVDRGVEVFHGLSEQNTEYPNTFLLSLQQAIENHIPVEMTYQSLREESAVCGRIVEPIAVCFYSLSWHLIGWCRLRSDYRDFRLDRIKSLTVLSEPFKPRAITTARSYFQHMRQTDSMEEVVVRVDKAAAPAMSSSRHYYGFVEEVLFQEYVEMVFVTNDITYIGRWLMMFIENVEVVSPPTLGEFLRNKIVLANHRILKSC